MSAWFWATCRSVLVLPWAIASLCDWAPRYARGRSSLRGIRIRGLALALVRVGGLVGPPAQWGPRESEGLLFSATMTQAVLLVASGPLVVSRFGARPRRLRPEQAWHGSPEPERAPRAGDPRA